MSHYIVGSDKSGKSDNDCIEKVCQILRDNGHTADNIGVTPNLESQFRSKGKGCIGVFLVNGICMGTFDSVMSVVKGGLMDYIIFGITKSYYGGGLKLPEELSSKKVPIAHDDNFTKEPRRSQLDGKYTVKEFCDENNQYINYAYGDDCEQVAQSILQGGGGAGGSGTGSETTSDDKEPTPVSYLEMIKDLISVWDGDVECKIRQDKMYINKVTQPKPQLWIVDGNNVVSGSAKVQDYNSDTINTLNVEYANHSNTITITDDYLINRFGPVEETIEAVKTVTNYGGDASQQADGGSQSPSIWTQIASILQQYYEKPSGGWDSKIRSVQDAKVREDIHNVTKSLTKKQEWKNKKSDTDIIQDLMKIRGLGY